MTEGDRYKLRYFGRSVIPCYSIVDTHVRSELSVVDVILPIPSGLDERERQLHAEATHRARVILDALNADARETQEADDEPLTDHEAATYYAETGRLPEQEADRG